MQSGSMFAYEVDGFGNALVADDANMPSLLSIPLLGVPGLNASSLEYLATRQAVLSSRNPYYFKGTAASGIGGPHVGQNYIWPMSIAVQLMTSLDESEVKDCLQTLVQTSACTGLMHESFNKNDFASFTRPWFAWSNSMLGRAVVDVAQRFPGLLQSAL